MTVAFGNLIVVIIAEAKFVDNQVHEYFLFAGLLSVATIVFGVLSFFYKYNDPKSEDEKLENGKKDNKDGIHNVVFSKNSVDSDIKLLNMKSFDTN